MLITNLPLLDKRRPSLNVEPVRGTPCAPSGVVLLGVVGGRRRDQFTETAFGVRNIGPTTMRSKGLGSIQPESSSTGSTRLLVCFVEGPTSGNQHGNRSD